MSVPSPARTSALRLYRRYMDLSRRWPADPLKGDVRDMGSLIRQRIATAFPGDKEEDHRVPDPARCEQMYKALDELASNKHMKDFPRSVSSNILAEDTVGVLGFTRVELSELTSEEKMREQGFRFGGEGTWYSWQMTYRKLFPKNKS